MRYLILALLVLSTSCVHFRMVGPFEDHYVKEDNKYVEHRQCSLPIVVTFDDMLEEKDIANFREAMAFWDKQFGATQSLFYDAGVMPRIYEFNSIHVRDVRQNEELPDHYAAVTLNDVNNKTGCIRHTEIVYRYPLQSYISWEQTKINQHEIGHALGYDDIHVQPDVFKNGAFGSNFNFDKLKVMYQDISALRDTDYMVDSEVNALRRMYLPMLGDQYAEIR